MGAIVLVHGSNDGGWVWQKVAPLLRAVGYEVYAPTLSGLGDRAHLVNCGVDLGMHINEIINLLHYEDLSDVTLVGNSYGGMVISGVAARAPERIKRLVYLDAYVPDDGQSEQDLWPEEMRAAVEADAATARGLRNPPPPAVFGITDPALADWVKERGTPQPVATYTEPVPAGSARSAAIERVYIHCVGGPATTTPVFAPFAAKARAAGWKVYELAAGHMAMLTAPRETAELLEKIAK
jgi:pimeloyl-ACP methyl ester carboxylesterase